MAIIPAFDATQAPILQEILQGNGHALLVGPAQSGKTSMLLELAARLSEQTDQSGAVCCLGFAWRSVKGLEYQAQQVYSAQFSKLRFGTIWDFAKAELTRAGVPHHAIDNTQMREILLEACADVGFRGLLREAEHIIRAFKSGLHKPSEDAPHYALFTAYQQRLKAQGWQDRPTIIREHLLNMQNELAEPVPAKVLLLDNVQDITPLQLRWLQEHALNGCRVVAAHAPDLSAYMRDGALGNQAREKLLEWGNVTAYELTHTYAIPANVVYSIGKLTKQLPDHAYPRTKAHNVQQSAVQVAQFENQEDELLAVLQHIRTVQQQDATHKIGIITRHDLVALHLSTLLEQHQMPHACYARSLWQTRVGRGVLAALYVLLNHGTVQHMRQVLELLGMPRATAQALIPEDLKLTAWLTGRVELPPASHPMHEAAHQVIGTESARDAAAMQDAQFIRQTVRGLWQLLHQQQLAPPEAFKAFVAQIYPRLAVADQPIALLSLQALLNIQGPLQDQIARLVQDPMPDPAATLVVAPVREVRNLQFTHVLLPQLTASSWPTQDYALLPPDVPHERRLFILALSRTQQGVYVSHQGAASPFLQEFQTALRTYIPPSDVRD